MGPGLPSSAHSRNGFHAAVAPHAVEKLGSGYNVQSSIGETIQNHRGLVSVVIGGTVGYLSSSVLTGLIAAGLGYLLIGKDKSIFYSK